MADADINAAIQKHLGATASPYSEKGAAASPPRAPQPMPNYVAPSKFEEDNAKGMGFDTSKILSRRPGLHQNAEVVGQAAKGMGDWMTRTFKDPFHIADPIEGAATGVESAAKAKSPGQMVGALSNVAGMMSDPVGNVKGKVQEITGIGASKEAMLEASHDHALATQKHIQGGADAVHSDAQAGMQAVSDRMDAAHPEGYYNKTDIQAKVQDAVGDLVKNPEKMPASVNNILAGPKKGSTSRMLTTNEQTAGNMVAKSGLKGAEAQSMLSNLGYAPQQIDAIMQNVEAVNPTETPKNWTHAQLVQLRSDVGRDLGGQEGKGVVGAATNKVYGILSQELRSGTEAVGKEIGDKSLGKDWLESTAKYKTYIDDFIRSPLRDTLTGQNASDIMGPLTGKDAILTKRILAKYRDYGLDTDTIAREVAGSRLDQTTDRWSRPSKLDLLLAAVSPKALAVRAGIPRAMRSPGVREFVAGKGFDVPDIPASKVALKRAQGK